MRQVNLPQPQQEFVPFNGGQDQVTPPFSVKPGMLRDAQNYEIGINGGYESIVGYERFSGQPSPSDATYAVINCTFSGTVSVDDTVTGATSAATAVVIAVTATYIAVTKITGTFVSGENLEVAAAVEAATTSVALLDGATTSILNAQYKNLAADSYRADIAAVTGSGSILGVWTLSDVVYAVRNNAGATAAAIYKSSASGWAAVSLGRELSFTSGGTYTVAVGNTITGAISGATAVITRVVLESGTWGGGDAAGRLIFLTQTGTFQAENLDVGANLNVATIAADSDAITLLPGGRFRTTTYNFGGSTGTLRIYGCDGVNRGFEFDGTTFVPIETGMTADTPDYVIAHKNHLFFAFGSSVQFSSIANPYVWSVVLGSGEIGVGDNVTGFSSEAGSETAGALAIFSRNSIHILYGNSSSDFKLVKYRDEIGAISDSVQTIRSTMMFDDRGITNLMASQEYGNFNSVTLSQAIHPFLIQRRRSVADSCIVRDKNQYRIFFTDGFAVYLTFDNDKLLGCMPVSLEDTPTCMFSAEDSTGDEVIMFGSDDGFVYQMEKGTSFDGDDIYAYLQFHNLFMGSPRILKAWRDLTIEVSGDGYHEFSFSYELDYNSVNVHQPTSSTEETALSTPLWDTDYWDGFFWDGATLSPSHVRLSGSSENIAPLFSSTSDYFSPIKLSGGLFSFIPRRRKR